ncbi:MAG: VOC family protein [Candidatus Cloacimonetes bacterium]|nr:VOC family protein [Candidatus Cloacimonadota bacterium]
MKKLSIILLVVLLFSSITLAADCGGCGGKHEEGKEKKHHEGKEEKHEEKFMAKSLFPWVEIPVVDFKRAQGFYEKLFVYEMKYDEFEGSIMGYLPDHSQGYAFTGSIVKNEHMKPSADGTLVYINCGDDLTEMLNRVEPAGGKVLVPKTLINEEIGYFAIFMDTEGNSLGFWSMK